MSDVNQTELDKNNIQKQVLVEKSETQINNDNSRRSKRRRSLPQLFHIEKTPSDGHCLYHAVLRGTRDKGLLPGSKFSDETGKKDVVQLRKAMIAYLERGEGTVVQNIKSGEFGENLYDEVLNRIKAGCNGDKLVEKISSKNWAKHQEISIIKELYNIDLAILKKDKAIKGEIGNNIIKPYTTILVYSNGNHYTWAWVKVPWQEFKRSRTNTLLKF